jgi:hypothetical protein
MHQLRMTSTIAVTICLVWLGAACAQAESGSDRLVAQVTKETQQGDQQLLQGNQAVLGKVEAVTSDQIKVNIGEVQPRFLPLKQAQEKKFPAIKPGDDLVIIVSEQNLIVDYHPLDHPSGSHKVVRGSIADNMPIGQDMVVIKTEGGKEQSFEVRSQARSKLGAIPVGTPAIFLIDETNKVVDATFASMDAVKEAHKQPEHKSPIKAANRKVDGTVVEPLRADRITIKTGEGERPFEVREIIHDKVSKLHKGESVILLVDNENKVVDIAVPPQ